MSSLSDTLGRRFTLTTELKPPRGPDTSGFLGEMEAVKRIGKITAVNVIDSPSARLFMSSLGASVMLRQNGIEPIFQMVCRDRNVLALESDLISAAAFGVENILALTGDHPKRGASDHPSALPVFDLDSTSLLSTVAMMNSGRDPSGVELNARCRFFPGAAVNPNVTPLEPEVLKMARKTAAGARFFQSQAVFDRRTLEAFLLKADALVGDVRKNVLVGMIPLASAKMIGFLNRLPGIRVPEDVARRVTSSADPQAEGVSVCLELIDDAKALGLAGVHIMPVGRLGSLEGIVGSL